MRILIVYLSASKPFFNNGTLTWNHSPDGTLHFWNSFYIQYLHNAHLMLTAKLCNIWPNVSRGISTMLGIVE